MFDDVPATVRMPLRSLETAGLIPLAGDVEGALPQDWEGELGADENHSRIATRTPEEHRDYIASLLERAHVEWLRQVGS